VVAVLFLTPFAIVTNVIAPYGGYKRLALVTVVIVLINLLISPTFWLNFAAGVTLSDAGASLSAIAVTTALFAAVAAIAAMRAAGTVNEVLVLKAQATRLQAEASDRWAAYQAKGDPPFHREVAAPPH
jgi:hypothetical protein